MQIIQTGNIQFTDSDQYRSLTSQSFNWCLYKKLKIACNWGKTQKQSPMYDPCSPQQIIWHFTEFDLNQAIKDFNFLANIRKKLDTDQIVSIPTKQDCLANAKSYVCFSTFSNAVFIIDQTFNKYKDDFKKFVDYVSEFGIQPKIQIKYSNQDLADYEAIATKNVIVDVAVDCFNVDKLMKLIDDLKRDQCNINVKLHITKSCCGRMIKFLTQCDPKLSIILYFQPQFISARKYTEIQSMCLTRGMTNTFISQCAKHHFSTSVIGSILLQVPCSACRFTVCLKNREVLACQRSSKSVGPIQGFKTIHDFWMSSEIVNKIRSNLIDFDQCKVLEGKL